MNGHSKVGASGMHRRRHDFWVTPEDAMDGCLARMLGGCAALIVLAGAIAASLRGVLH